MKHERWREEEVVGLPIEEADNLERKSGRLLGDKGLFLDAMGKVLSAMANSGGGSIILGAEDDGVLSGIPPLIGKEYVRDWLEQKLPNLLDYPLTDFRIHTVERAPESTIPADMVVVVIDVADSSLAPHQSNRDRIYYHRVAGRSKAAPHFYIELLRLRVTNAVLKLSLHSTTMVSATEYDNGMFIHFRMTLQLENLGNVTAYKWRLITREIGNPGYEINSNSFYFDKSKFPVQSDSYGGIPLDTAILPGCTYNEVRDMGLHIQMDMIDKESIFGELSQALENTFLIFQVATETSPGERTQIDIGPSVDLFELTDQVFSYTTPR